MPVYFTQYLPVLAYYYIAETNVAYLRRALKINVSLTLVKFLIMFMVAYGTVNTAGYIWNLGDVGVGLMAWLNIVGIIAIFFMSRPTMKTLRDDEDQKAAGVTEYTFNPKALGIKGAEFWEKRYDEQQAQKNAKK